MVSCSTSFSKLITGTLIDITSSEISGLLAPKKLIFVLKKTSHSFSPGIEKIEYSPEESSFPLISISHLFLINVCLFAPVLQYFPKGTSAVSDSSPKINLSFLKGLL